MNKFVPFHTKVSRLIFAAFAVVCMGAAVPVFGLEDKLDLLQIGTNGYTNVTVTTKTKAYIFIVHSKGITNIKVKDLPPDIRVKLGYESGSSQSAAANPAAWAKQEFSKLPLAQVPHVEKQLNRLVSAGVPRLQLMGREAVLIILGTVLLSYLGFCYCSKLVCQKAGSKPGVWIWVPFAQLFPLLRAAGMSAGWIIVCLIPLLNLVVHAVWSVKIVRASGKSPIVALLLLLPLMNLFAFLYLAFSSSPSPKEERVVEVMTLEAA